MGNCIIPAHRYSSANRPVCAAVHAQVSPDVGRRSAFDHCLAAFRRFPNWRPTPHEYPANTANFLVKLLSNVAFKPLPLPQQVIVEPDTTDKVKLGKYVADGMIGCFACHSQDLKTLNDLEPEKTPGFYGGGTACSIWTAKTEVITANITMDPTTGIGQLTEQEFIDAVRYCKRPGGGQITLSDDTPHRIE